MHYNSRRKKMIKTKLFTAIAIILMFVMAPIFVTVPIANAHTPPWTISTYAFISVEPNPIGVGQTAYVNFWLDKVPPTSIGGWGMMWHNFKVDVTDPDGHTESLGTFDSDSPGGAWTKFVPEQVGEYTFEFTFPGQTVQLENPYPYALPYLTAITYDYINDTYTGSSASTTLIVQEEPIETAYPLVPLPTEYWTRPVNSMNREWYSIAGNWLGLGAIIFGNAGEYDNNGNFNPYTEAPNTAHVLWTKPEAFGGQIGGEFGASETGLYATGTAYEAKFGAVMINGVLYYTQVPGAATNFGPLTAVDARTGQTLWTVNASNTLRAGMIYNFITGDQYGAHAYLFTSPEGYGLGFIGGTTPNLWSMYDAMTGQWILDIANVTDGTLVEGEHGELLCYSLGYDGMLKLWNASKCIAKGQESLATQEYSPAEIWRPPQGATIDYNGGIEWSVPVATEVEGAPIGAGGLAISHISEDIVLLTAFEGLGTGGVPGGAQTGWRVDAGYNAVDGHLVWGPINRVLTPYTNVEIGPAGEGVFTEYTAQTMTWSAYDLKTGKKIWGPTEPYTSVWGYYDNEAKGVIGYGNLYAWSINGEVHAYDIKTGDLKWSWSTGSAGVDTPYGIWPLGTWQMQHILADGKLYVRAGHDYTPPVFKGAKLYCINATSGDEIWDSLSFNIISSPAVADGIMFWLNGYDNQIYAYGKGPSATTVLIQNDVITHGDSVLVKGSVVDKSSGTEQNANTARFPNGVPAISDEYMSAWMEYLYQQQPLPQDATGVEVVISVLDPNGNVYDVGTTTSNADGTFGLSYTPLVPGIYTVYATFEGSDSYYGSHASTYLSVLDTPTGAAEATPVPASAADLYFLPVSIGIIIAIVVIGLVIILMLRKR
jgi:outer membrane protein assembly factor BamB